MCINWLVVSTPLKHISQLGLSFHMLWKKSCSKPPLCSLWSAHCLSLESSALTVADTGQCHTGTSRWSKTLVDRLTGTALNSRKHKTTFSSRSFENWSAIQLACIHIMWLCGLQYWDITSNLAWRQISQNGNCTKQSPEMNDCNSQEPSCVSLMAQKSPRDMFATTQPASLWRPEGLAVSKTKLASQKASTGPGGKASPTLTTLKDTRSTTIFVLADDHTLSYDSADANPINRKTKSGTRATIGQ